MDKRHPGKWKIGRRCQPGSQTSEYWGGARLVLLLQTYYYLKQVSPISDERLLLSATRPLAIATVKPEEGHEGALKRGGSSVR